MKTQLYYVSLLKDETYVSFYVAAPTVEHAMRVVRSEYPDHDVIGVRLDEQRTVHVSNIVVAEMIKDHNIKTAERITALLDTSGERSEYASLQTLRRRLEDFKKELFRP